MICFRCDGCSFGFSDPPEGPFKPWAFCKVARKPIPVDAEINWFDAQTLRTPGWCPKNKDAGGEP